MHDALQPRERNFAQRTFVGDVAIELQQRFLNALPRERAGRIVRHDAPQHAIGIDRDTGRRAAADRVAATTAAELGVAQLAATTNKHAKPSATARSERRPDGDGVPARDPNRAMEYLVCSKSAMFRARASRSGG